MRSLGLASVRCRLEISVKEAVQPFREHGVIGNKSASRRGVGRGRGESPGRMRRKDDSTERRNQIWLNCYRTLGIECE